MRVVVTGAAGFTGSHICELVLALLCSAAPRWQTLVFAR
jgi:uncharacterized protein YbjT (DUF2867 family)